MPDRKLPSDEEVYRLYYIEGMTQDEIGKEFGTTRAAVYLVLKRIGQSPSRKGQQNKKTRCSVSEIRITKTGLAPVRS